MSKLPAGRPIYIGGYSLGDVIAIDVADTLLNQGVAVEKLMLRDPVPLTQTQVRTRIRNTLWSISERMSKGIDKDGLDRMLTRQNRHLKRLLTGYKPDKLPDISISVLRSTQGNPNDEPGWLEKYKGINFNYLACGHLVFLSHPLVSQSADWLENELATLRQSPE